MTAFDKAWGVAKTRGFDIRDHNGEDPLGDALDTARSKKRKPLPKNLGGMVRTGDAPLELSDLLRWTSPSAEEALNEYNEGLEDRNFQQEEAFDRHLEDMDRQAYRDGEMTDEERQDFLSSSIGAKWREEPESKEVKTG
tara:strand:+ start:6825 stop:7241 length:417 start_codon:yes stop_codon:yes gene_type:complete